MSPKDGPDMLYDQRRIREERLVAKLKQWVDYGVAEEMVYRAIASMNKLGHEDFEALTEKFVFVLLGATSEMGATPCERPCQRSHCWLTAVGDAQVLCPPS